jgi:hypothetical protein
MPENKSRNCVVLSVIEPSCTGGHVKLPASNRL